MNRFLNRPQVLARIDRGDYPERLENYAAFADGRKARIRTMRELEDLGHVTAAKPNIGAKWLPKAIHLEGQKRLPSAPRHYGNTDTKTSPHTYFFGVENAVAEHREQFAAVWRRLNQLVETKDGNGYKIVDLLFSRLDDKVAVVAYRFTSDWAYDRYYGEVQQLGRSLGRGGFEPFGGRGYDYENYLAADPRQAMKERCDDDALHLNAGRVLKALARAIRFFEDNGGDADYTWLPKMKAAARDAASGAEIWTGYNVYDFDHRG